MTDALGRVRTASYDALDQPYLTMEPHPTAIGGTLGQISAAYDGQGQIAGIIDPRGLSTNYTVDGLGNVLTIQSPDSGTTQNGYDEAGNLKTSTNAKGQTTTFQYDALNRLTRAAYADGQAFTYGYDQGSNGIGHLTSAGDGTSLTQWTYDNQGRVSGKSQSLRGRTLTVGYGYGPGGRIERITYPSGHILAYGYDSAGRITSLTVDGTTLLSGITYVPFGPPQGWTWGNGTTHQRSYDASGRLTSITLPAEPADNQTYGYDGLDRLTDASMVNGTTNLNYLYDLSGNRTQQTKGTQVTNYTISPSSNRLTMVNTTNISSDANGSITNDGSNGFTYDARGRLTSANGTSYQIDALGQRIEKAGAGANTPSGARQFLYDEQHHLIGEYDRTSGSAIAEHIYLNDWPVAVIQNGTLYYVHPDHLGAPRTITRPSDNQVMWWWAREPFGTATAQSVANIEYNLRLPGQYADVESGASQNLFRDNYFSAFGRYGQSDPVGLAGGSWSTFAYANGNPMNYYDPYGLFGWADMPTAPDWLVDGAAGFGDTISMGATGLVRNLSGIGSVHKCSSAYQVGEVGGVLWGLAWGGATVGRHAANVGEAAFFSDAREYATVQNVWSRSVGGYKGQYELHHWFTPQSAGGTSAGWNLAAVSPWLNRAMGDGGLLFETFRAAMIGAYLGAAGAVPTAIVDSGACECRK